MSVWWPTIGKDINKIVRTCKLCLKNKPTQRKEPLMTSSLPNRPWQKTAADICEQCFECLYVLEGIWKEHMLI